MNKQVVLDKRVFSKSTGNTILDTQTLSKKVMTVNEAIAGCGRLLQKNEGTEYMSTPDKTTMALLLVQGAKALHELLTHAGEEGKVSI